MARNPRSSGPPAAQESRMSVDPSEPRPTFGPPRRPWRKLLGGAGVATDARKLILAAVGLLAMTAGWWALDQVMPDPGPWIPEAEAMTPRVVVDLPPAFPGGTAPPRGIRPRRSLP